jgi:hypothetical protein
MAVITYTSTIHAVADPQGATLVQLPGYVRGPQKTTNPEYRKVTPPDNVPNYSIARLMDFYLTFEDVYVPLFIKIPNITNIVSAGDTFFTTSLVDQYKATTISHIVYQTADLFWLVFLNNGVLNPFVELAPGTILRLPELGVVVTNWLSS